MDLGLSDFWSGFILGAGGTAWLALLICFIVLLVLNSRAWRTIDRLTNYLTKLISKLRGDDENS